MSDNVLLNAGSGGKTVASHDVGGLQYQKIISGHPVTLTKRATYSTAQTDAAIVTQATGGQIVVTRISVAAAVTNTHGASVIIGFGTANTPTTTSVVYSHPGFPAGFQFSEGSGDGILGIGADDEDLRITTSAADTFDVVVSYYIL